MSETKMPASGDPAFEGKADGVSDTPDRNSEANVHGRAGGGESGGGAYPNPQSGKEPGGRGFEGGQSDKAYHGGGQAGDDGGDAPNAATGSSGSDGHERDALPPPAAEHTPREVSAGGRTFDVVEMSGTVEAEAAGKVGTDASYEAEQKSPGSG